MKDEYEKCLRCGRKLKTPFARTIGYGKVCWEKYNSEDSKDLFPVNELAKAGDKNAIK